MLKDFSGKISFSSIKIMKELLGIVMITVTNKYDELERVKFPTFTRSFEV